MIQKQSILNEQLAFLWGPAYQEAVFFPLYTFLSNCASSVPPEQVSKTPPQPQQSSSSSSSSSNSLASSHTASKSATTLKSSLVKVFRKALFLDGMQGSSGVSIRLNAEITILVSEACKLYYNICTSFSL